MCVRAACVDGAVFTMPTGPAPRVLNAVPCTCVVTAPASRGATCAVNVCRVLDVVENEMDDVPYIRGQTLYSASLHHLTDHRPSIGGFNWDESNLGRRRQRWREDNGGQGHAQSRSKIDFTDAFRGVYE